MSFSLESAYVQRAQAALNMATQNAGAAAKRRAFLKMAFEIMQADPSDPVGARMKRLAALDPVIEKAVSHDLGNPEWEGGAAPLAASYLASVAEFSLLDTIKMHCRVLPTASQGRVLLAAGAVGNLTREGDPVPCQNLNLTSADIDPIRSAALVILSQELVRAGGDAVLALFEQELTSAVGRASNGAVLDQLIDSNTESINSTGDPLSDLRAGLSAAGEADAYAVAMPAATVRDLATRSEAGPGLGVRGGVFRPGISIVAIDDVNDTIVIPCSRLAVWDGGLHLKSAEHATVQMASIPTNNSVTPVGTELVSLWQAGLFGLMIDRSWHLGGDTSGIVIVEGSST